MYTHYTRSDITILFDIIPRMNISFITTELLLGFIVILIALYFITQLLAMKSLMQQIRDIPQVQASKLFEQELSDFKQTFSGLSASQQSLQESLSQLTQESKSIKKTSLIRYNPFRDSGVGGLQSFSAAVVDSEGNGLVLTNLFSREMTRISAKEITAWQPVDQELSPEEKQALEEAKVS